jgi:hypothetical protein
MKKIKLTILTIILSSITLFGQESDLSGFESFLGKEKTIALNELNGSFESFLKTNYPKIDNENDRIYKFLDGYKNWSVLEKDWKIDNADAKKTLEQFEKSGLRIEFWKYGYETYKPEYQIDNSILPQEDTSNLDTLSLGDLYIDDIEEEIIPITNGGYDPELEEKLQRQRDGSQSFNHTGQFIYGLAKYGSKDSLIAGYVDAKYAVGDISPSLIVGGLTVDNLDLSFPLRKRIILMEFYYHFLQWSIENKKKIR